MTAWTPECRACGSANPGTWSRCPGCGGVQVLAPPATPPGGPDPYAEGVWRHRAALPPVPVEISLGEGGTPLIPCPRLGPRVLVKNEAANPTLSFKDRAMALGVSHALALSSRPDAVLRGVRAGVVAASTGNTAVSAAAYAARAGLACRVVCAEAAADGAKVALARAFGAEVHAVDGDFSAAHAAAAAMEADGWYPLTTTFRNPYLTEAHRTIAYEIAARIGVPDWILVPVGAGPLLVGLHHGFQALGGRIPRLVAVQAQACAPLATAWTSGAPIGTVRPEPTVAEAIADPLRGYEDEGALTLEAVRDSGGTAIAVPDPEIAAATARLAREGLSLEPAAAAPLAALNALTATGAIPPDATVVLLATGHGAKEPPRPPRNAAGAPGAPTRTEARP